MPQVGQVLQAALWVRGVRVLWGHVGRCHHRRRLPSVAPRGRPSNCRVHALEYAWLHMVPLHLSRFKYSMQKCSCVSGQHLLTTHSIHMRPRTLVLVHWSRSRCFIL